jgi:hypothetical protein
MRQPPSIFRVWALPPWFLMVCLARSMSVWESQRIDCPGFRTAAKRETSFLTSALGAGMGIPSSISTRDFLLELRQVGITPFLENQGVTTPFADRGVFVSNEKV